jgi:hypothetical protein
MAFDDTVTDMATLPSGGQPDALPQLSRLQAFPIGPLKQVLCLVVMIDFASRAG